MTSWRRKIQMPASSERNAYRDAGIQEKKESFTEMFPYEHFMVLLAVWMDGSEMPVNIIQMSGCFISFR